MAKISERYFNKYKGFADAETIERLQEMHITKQLNLQDANNIKEYSIQLENLISSVLDEEYKEIRNKLINNEIKVEKELHQVNQYLINKIVEVAKIHFKECEKNTEFIKEQSKNNTILGGEHKKAYITYSNILALLQQKLNELISTKRLYLEGYDNSTMQ